MKFQRKRSLTCTYCEASVGRKKSTNDHVPSRFLLRRPFPPNSTTVRACKACNESYAPHEEYFAVFLGMMLSDGSANESNELEKRVSSNHSLQDQLVDRISTAEMACTGRLFIEPDINRLKLIVQKNALGHIASAGYVRPSNQEPTVSIVPLENLHGTQGMKMFEPSHSWCIVQNMTYRYSVSKAYPTSVRSVLFEYLATECIW